MDHYIRDDGSGWTVLEADGHPGKVAAGVEIGRACPHLDHPIPGQSTTYLGPLPKEAGPPSHTENSPKSLTVEYLLDNEWPTEGWARREISAKEDDSGNTQNEEANEEPVPSDLEPSLTQYISFAIDDLHWLLNGTKIESKVVERIKKVYDELREIKDEFEC